MTPLLDTLVRHSYLAKITHADTSSANAKTAATPQINDPDTSSANAKKLRRHRSLTQTPPLQTPISLRPHKSTWHAFGTTPDALATVESLTADTQTVANGCGRSLRTVADTNATFGQHSLDPRPTKWNGNPRYAFGNMLMFIVTFIHMFHCPSFEIGPPRRRPFLLPPTWWTPACHAAASACPGTKFPTEFVLCSKINKLSFDYF